MSLKKSATRRLSLLAGSSFLGAGLTAFMTAGAALAPTAAVAQATCAPAPSSGNGTNTVVYAAGTYNPGITCAYVGDNATVSTSGAITVSSTAGGAGINLTATGTDDITWTSTAGTVTGSSQTNGPVIDARTASGNINVTVANITGSAATVTHGIYAQSTGAGNIAVISSSVSATNTTSGNAAIEAISAGGAINVQTSNANGRLYGIRAQTSGAGSVTITGNANMNATTGLAAINAVSGTGLLRIDSTSIGSSSSVGNGILATAGGDVLLNVGSVQGTGLDNWVIDLSTASGTLTTVNATGTIGNAIALERKAFRLAGGADLDLSIAGMLGGIVDFAGAGDVNLAIGEAGSWQTGNGSVFGAGDDTVFVETGGYLATAVATLGTPDISAETVTIDFGAGDDRLSNAGVIMFGAGSDTLRQIELSTDFRYRGEVETRLLGLETFENSGLIMLGGLNQDDPAEGQDGYSDDVLTMPGTAFIGSGDSVIAFDVNLSGSQTACDVSLRDPVDMDMPAADCVNIAGGSTAGLTRVLVTEQIAGDRGSFGEIVLIDVSGGTSDAGHFVLDPESTRYSAANGGIIDKGFFVYPLVYDADTQQHKLVAAAGGSAQQFSLVAQAAHSLWRLSSGSWLDRQADLRGDVDGGVGGGVWMRLATEFTDRDALQTVDVLGSPFTFDNTHSQSSYAVTGGLDVISGASAGMSYVAGLTAGYIHSDLEYDASPNAQRLDGWSGGAYASLLAGGLFVDAAINANRLELEADIPGLELMPTGTMLATNLTSVGGQLEAGWRFPVMGVAFVEPLAGVSYVRTKWDDLYIATEDPLREGVTLEFDDPASLRASVGGRVGLDQSYGGVRAQYSLLGRVWNEFEDETRLVAHNTGEDAAIFDEFTGTFTEVGLGASLYGLDGAVSGFLNLGGKFGDDYEAQTGSVGVRVNW